MIPGMLGKHINLKSASPLRSAVCAGIGLLSVCDGLYVFIERNFIIYLFLQSEVLFMDYSESVFLFYLDHLAIVGLAISAAHHVSKLCRRPGKYG